jgi:hemerythrin-like domain-containing protein
MKRHPHLREFSDDHHQGLVMARRLKKAGSGEEKPEQAARSFLEFWKEETEPHFVKEEDALLPVLARYGVRLDSEPLVRMFVQHHYIRTLVARLELDLARQDVKSETLTEVGELLDEHIRLEEREVFPMVEESLNEDALEEVADRLAGK